MWMKYLKYPGKFIPRDEKTNIETHYIIIKKFTYAAEVLPKFNSTIWTKRSNLRHMKKLEEK